MCLDVIKYKCDKSVKGKGSCGKVHEMKVYEKEMRVYEKEINQSPIASMKR